MIPMRTPFVFKSRWMALLWAAGILWFAYDFTAPGEPENAGADEAEITDASGAPVSSDEARQLEAAIRNL
jgi:hypothetical protein